jgi:phosphopantothenoylcysteine decarboxylase/phosphopantothenate--cysteine ligase
MKRLNGKHVLLGITGGIAAYKSAELTRRLLDEGAQVRVVMTPGATAFVTPLTFQALSGNPVHTELLDAEAEKGMGHIELARWADVVLVAPASANTIARMAQGRAEDLLTTLCLATEAPIAVAPSMNRVMWEDLSTQHNIRVLTERGILQFGPVRGSQACGENGDGRMLDVPVMIDRIAGLFRTGSLQGLNVMITAGPTREPIDPVRFIGNRSSGRMGYALAEAATEAGARVTLISGPTAIEPPADVDTVRVETAAQMFDAVMSRLDGQQIFIGAAAVADYRPQQAAAHKMKKSSDTLQLTLERTDDILAAVSNAKQRPFTVGFAAETENLKQNARAKLRDKQLDMIAANQVGRPAGNTDERQDIGFNSEFNALHVMWADGGQVLQQARKSSIARQLVRLIAEHYHKHWQHEKNTA